MLYERLYGFLPVFNFYDRTILLNRMEWVETLTKLSEQLGVWQIVYDGQQVFINISTDARPKDDAVFSDQQCLFKYKFKTMI